MKRVATVVFLLFLTALPLRGGSYDFGLGIILGEPTGITFKYWASDKAAFDGALAWSFSKEDKFHIMVFVINKKFPAVAATRIAGLRH